MNIDSDKKLLLASKASQKLYWIVGESKVTHSINNILIADSTSAEVQTAFISEKLLSYQNINISRVVIGNLFK